MKKIAIIGTRGYKRNHNYYDAVEALGEETVEVGIGAQLDCIKDVNGVIIPGGVDVNPALYHAQNTDSVNIFDELDALDMEVIKIAVDRCIPILGTCRGHQILNVFFGGSLIQNVENCCIHRAVGLVDRVHEGRVEKNSFLYEIYGTEKIMTNSAHHQAIKTLGKGLRAVEFADDGIIEAMCHESLPIYGVQWHPERMCFANHRDDTVDGAGVFKYFLTKC